METSKTTEYLDGFQGLSAGSPLILKFVPTAEGYYNLKIISIYSYTDHLGNVRLSYSKNLSGSAEILEENNYYAFGLKHEGYNALAGNPAYSYGYNGKELQKETGWGDYGARMYMSDIGRWGVIDPLAEQMRRYSPYNYAFNNPVSFIDPDGMAPRQFAMAGDGFGNVDVSSGWTNPNWLGLGDRGGSYDQLASVGGGIGGDLEMYEGAAAADAFRTLMNPQYNFSQFDFSKFGDDITVGKDGKVKGYVRNGKPNRFFDVDGMELFFNDPINVDKLAQGKIYNIGDRVYNPIDYNEFLKAIASVPHTNKIRALLAQGRLGNAVISPSAQLSAYAMIGYESTYGEADFSAHYLSRKLDVGNNTNQNDAFYHVRFGNTNTIYSLMDAGNFMWGGWSKFIGLLNHEVTGGVNTYEYIYNGRADTNADSKSIFNGRAFLLSK
ncbi:RHS repeat domain-containing protein [Chryseobacterium lathyri]|uniref:RHS repeat domain-containing protein n=2 Tax=Chryseobacterium lathyri TaxID=395933 RepID=UPI003B8A9221